MLGLAKMGVVGLAKPSIQVPGLAKNGSVVVSPAKPRAVWLAFCQTEHLDARFDKKGGQVVAGLDKTRVMSVWRKQGQVVDVLDKRGWWGSVWQRRGAGGGWP